MSGLLRVEEEVQAALASGRPVVALESTLIAHGLPWPENLGVAREMEEAVRGAGAVPATIALIEGVPRIGLTPPLLERLAESGPAVRKAGAADLAVLMTQGADAATTVSATAFLAARVGIVLFATGGIGGVHRLADSDDISNDLTVLSRAPVAVVSAGAKAILDLDRTLEALETLGVLVVGYGTDELPAFYTRRSGIRLEHRVDDPVQAAAVLRHRFEVLGQGGVLLCNPVDEASALAAADVDAAIDSALARAEARGIRGKALTPFLLAELARSTGGATVRANRSLAVANAKLAAAIAVALEPISRTLR